MASSPAELTEQLGRHLIEAGAPLWRLNVSIWTLHPLLVGNTYTWLRDGGAVETGHTPRGALRDPAYLNSPVRIVCEGLGGVRQRLDIDDPEFEFPVMRDLRAAGGTDYVAMPLPFSDGQIHSLTLTSDHADGFSVAQLGRVFEAVPVLSRLYEVHTVRQNTAVLLDTYLGPRTGAWVRDGLTQRGDGESIHAVIWFSDLRASTALADSMERPAFLECLNQFFDSMVGAVLDNGGEVLRFVGDAVLAIFLIAEPGRDDAVTTGAALACEGALAAVRAADRRIGAVNQTRRERRQPELGYGVGLHLGDVTYGNIGTPERLEFTVVGPAANQASRLQDACKRLEVRVLISAEFARHHRGELRSAGRLSLRGDGAEQEVFTLPQAPLS